MSIKQTIFIMIMVVALTWGATMEFTRPYSDAGYNTKDISDAYFHKYILSETEWIKSAGRVDLDSLNRIELKSDIYYEIYQKCRP